MIKELKFWIPKYLGHPGIDSEPPAFFWPLIVVLFGPHLFTYPNYAFMQIN